MMAGPDLLSTEVLSDEGYSPQPGLAMEKREGGTRGSKRVGISAKKVLYLEAIGS
jgi:hypothetical protein